MSKSNKIMIQCCICGAGTKKSQAPAVPYTPEEIALHCLRDGHTEPVSMAVDAQ